MNLPAALPGWILPYYFSYVLCFAPFSGVGNIILSVGYFSFVFINTTTVLYSVPNSLYLSNPYSPPTSPSFDLNTGFQGNIYWIAAAVLWVGTTFSQKYNKKKP